MTVNSTNKYLHETLTSLCLETKEHTNNILQESRVNARKKCIEILKKTKKSSYWNNLSFNKYTGSENSEKDPTNDTKKLFEKLVDVSINIVNGFVKTTTMVLPNNVDFLDLSQINERDFLNYLNKTTNDKDPLINLNNGTCTKGFVLNVEDNSKPQIIHIHHEIKNTGLEQSRQIINIAPNAHVTFIETFQGNTESFENTLSQWVVNENAHLVKYSFGSRAGQHKKSQSVHTEIIEQHTKSKCDLYSFFFSRGALGFQGNIRNNIMLELLGENISSKMWSVSMLKDEVKVDNNISLKHLKPNCSSSQIFKGLYSDESSGQYDSCVYVAQHAQKSNTVQKNNNILLGDKSRVNSNPQLEIFADDVACAHGSTIGQIDDQAMFYMRSRGISENTAQKLLLSAFVSDVVDSVANEKLKKIITDEIDKQFE